MTGTPIRRAKAEHEERVFSTADALESLLDEIADGLGMSGWCAKMGVRYRSCVAWVMSDTERARAVDEAERARARLSAEAGAALGRKLAAPNVRTGHEWIDDGDTLEPKAARVALDAFKFAATAGDREKFGRSVQHTHVHKMQADHLQALRRASRADGPARSPSSDTGSRQAHAHAQHEDAIAVEWRALPAPEVQVIDSIVNAVRLPALPVSPVIVG